MKHEQEIVNAICKRYTKIVRMNLTLDSYEIIQAPEMNPKDGTIERTYKLSVWFEKVLASDLIHEDDKELFEHFSNIKNIMDALSNTDSPYISIHYRRKDADKYRWAVMDIIRCDEWSEGNQIAMGLVRDVHNDYAHEWEYLEALEQINSYDQTTVIRNRVSYNRLIRQIENSDDSVGVIFCDVNALKYVNDHYGHKAGDAYLKAFADLLCRLFRRSDCYRISGDEFVVIVQGVQSIPFRTDFFIPLMHAVLDDHGLDKVTWPIASIGVAWSQSGKNITDTVALAEDNMYKDKQQFYIEYPHFKR